jgi:hypothetical protein
LYRLLKTADTKSNRRPKKCKALRRTRVRGHDRKNIKPRPGQHQGRKNLKPQICSYPCFLGHRSYVKPRPISTKTGTGGFSSHGHAAPRRHRHRLLKGGAAPPGQWASSRQWRHMLPQGGAGTGSSRQRWHGLLKVARAPPWQWQNRHGLLQGGMGSSNTAAERAPPRWCGHGILQGSGGVAR